MQVQPYLMFDGKCEEAIEFYKKAVGAEVTRLLRFKDGPQPTGDCKPAAGTENKIMHAALRVGETTVMATDGQVAGQTNFKGFSLALTAIDDDQAKRLFAALSDGGRVEMPLAKTFFSTNFGMVVDRFGVSWMIVAGPAQ